MQMDFFTSLPEQHINSYVPPYSGAQRLCCLNHKIMLTIIVYYGMQTGPPDCYCQYPFYLKSYMHELGIAQSIMQIVLSEAEKARARKVLKVTVKVGELAGVLPDSLTFCFNLLAKSTIAEHASLTIEKVPVRGYCSAVQKRICHCRQQVLLQHLWEQTHRTNLGSRASDRAIGDRG